MDTATLVPPATASIRPSSLNASAPPIIGLEGKDLLIGSAAGETIYGMSGNDLIDGGGGRDVLIGGARNDVFRFSSREDSYRTDSASFSDHIRDLDPLRESLDLTDLGFVGLGDGYDNTLALRADAQANRTYLKSFEPDANGHRFEVVLEGVVAPERLYLYFERPVLDDGSYGDTLIAGNVASELLGHRGDDRIHGGLANDLLDGGEGRDKLFGSLGFDTYRYTSIRDSYRDDTQTFSDRILGFDPDNDRIDVSALGFTGLGDGHDHTLAIWVNAAGVTYLKDYDADSLGRRFELTLSGDFSDALTAENFVFADPADGQAPLSLLGTPEQTPPV
jgi:Ca2+-binding RTX toxin-like protein